MLKRVLFIQLNDHFGEISWWCCWTVLPHTVTVDVSVISSTLSCSCTHCLEAVLKLFTCYAFK